MGLGALIGLLIGVSPAFSLEKDFGPSVHQDELVQVKLYPLQDQLQAGAINLWGLDFQLEPGWHIYWKNPGDSGAPLILNWAWESAQLTDFLFPPPKRIPIGPLVNFGYEDRVIFPIQALVDSLATRVQVELELEWLVCKIECIPGFSTLRLSTPAGDQLGNPHPHKDLALQFLQSAPSPLTEYAHRIEQRDEQLWFSLKLPKPLDAKAQIQVFPYDNLFFSSQPPEELAVQGSDLVFSLRQAAQGLSLPTDPRVLIVIEDKVNKEGSWSYTVHLEFNLHSSGSLTLFFILILAFLGGIVLNAMPCVLPVLSIKILSFSQSSGSSKHFKLTSWLYCLGVVSSFALMGLALQLIRLGGEEIGWGFQLQSPAFVSAMAMLFFLLGLNFLGVFEWGQSLSQQSAKLSTRSHGLRGAFFTGVLAALVASPCTAPFMGTALGASLMLSSWLSPLVFISLGLGMAFPFLLLAHIPALLRLMPRPGPWMVKLKEFFAFPLFLTALWLIWVLSLQAGTLQTLIVLSGFTSLSFSLWLLKNFQKTGLRWLAKALIGSSLVAPSALAIKLNSSSALTHPSRNSSSAWQAFDSQRVQQLVNEGESVFIDFTAAWCITCQVNKLNVLDRQGTRDLFTEQGVHLFRADWTSKDPEITRALADYGRNSLPLYVFYPPNSQGQFQLLPELLTAHMIEQLFK